METLLLHLMWSPKFWQKLEWWLISACLGLMFAGWQLSRRMHRIEDRTGVVFDLQKALEHVPFIRTSPEGYALLGFGLVAGGLLAYLGRWAKSYG